jgi:ATPase subunit of ABC transporter with duplicated ATPase domains
VNVARLSSRVAVIGPNGAGKSVSVLLGVCGRAWVGVCVGVVGWRGGAGWGRGEQHVVVKGGTPSEGVSDKGWCVCGVVVAVVVKGRGGVGGGHSTHVLEGGWVADKDTGFKLNSVNVAARLSSRVAVIGPNGAATSR